MDLCPRQALAGVVKQATRTSQLEFLVGFEVGLQAIKQAEDGQSGMVSHSHGPGHFAAAGMLDPCWPIVGECVQRLRSLRVQVWSLHTEGLCGQYEITLAPLPPLQAVDQLVLVNSVLKQTFDSHGLTVTMSPKPIAGGQQQLNGQHMHISTRITDPLRDDAFLAGMLKRLPNLWAFFLPHKASYDRVEPWMAGDSVSWGTENRTVPIRKIKSHHWEVRSMEATANVYLALAATLSAGLFGIAGKEPLNWPDVTFLEAGTTIHRDPLPRSLIESLPVLCAGSGDLDSILGKRLIKHYVDLKRYELAQIEQMGSEKARNLLIQLF